MHRLITIPFSHYNERARWGLDRCRVPYRETGYLPGMHILPVAWATKLGGRADRVSSPLSTPLLVTSEGRVIQDSGAILRFADAARAEGTPTLFSTAEADELSERYHDELGPHARRLAYHHLFTDPEAIRRAAYASVGRIQATAFWLSRRLVRAAITRALNVTADAAARSRARVERLFDETSRRLADRPFLAGDAFSAADLSFAALASPVCSPATTRASATRGCPPSTASRLTGRPSPTPSAPPPPAPTPCACSATIAADVAAVRRSRYRVSDGAVPVHRLYARENADTSA